MREVGLTLFPAISEFDYKTVHPSDLCKSTREVLQKAQEIINNVLAPKKVRTVKNTFLPFNEYKILLENLGGLLWTLKNTHTRANVRTAAQKYLQKIIAFDTRLSLNPNLFEAINAVNVERADAITRRWKKKMISEFKRSGVDKDEETRKKITELQNELTALMMKYSENTTKRASITVTNETKLNGIPQNVVNRFRKSKKGEYVITTDYSDYFVVMQFAKDEDLRRELEQAFLTRAPENEEILKQMLQKRLTIARFLGHENWPGYATENMMSKTPKAVEEFITMINKTSRASSKAEVALISKYIPNPIEKDGLIGSWNREYYPGVIKSKKFEYNAEELMEYFPYQQVKKGILAVYGDLFGIEFVPNKEANVWHKTVECYDVYESGKLVARYYLDMHPRKGKYGHAMCGEIIQGIKNRRIPEVLLVCNFAGGKKSDGPALMQYSQVETFFHEFGHGLHAAFARNQQWIAFSGIKTEWDFVEAPSQLMEQWLFDSKVLQRISHHYKTGKPIPQELVQKLQQAEKFGKGLFVHRQGFLTALSFYMHTEDPDDLNIAALARKLEKTHSPFVLPDGTHMWTSWVHLTGYSSNYYTYMWSKVIAMDILTGFDKSNLMNKKIAQEYRKRILEPGGSKDAADLVQDFLGRPYSFDAFKQWLNS